MEDSDDLAQLELLLAAEASDDEKEVKSDEKLEQSNVGFLEDVAKAAKKPSSSRKDASLKEASADEKSSLVHNGDTDSSDDEDKRNFCRKYDDYGSEIKRMLDVKEQDLRDKEFERENSFASRLRAANSKSEPQVREDKTPVVNHFSKLITNDTKTDLYTDPVFGIRIMKPLISNAGLLERMQGRQPVKLDNIKKHVQYGDLSLDWVFAGVIVRKSDTCQSQKGNQFSIWTLSDLKNDLKSVSLFLFKNAYKSLWKTAQGTIVGVLNPNVLDKRDSKNEASLSVDNPDKVMIIGSSKDLGFCRSRKKNGDPCNTFVNLSFGEVCIFHVRQEYQKFANRSELQSPTMGRGIVNLQNKVFGKDTYMYGGKAFSAAPKTTAKDRNRLMSLDSYLKKTENDHLKINKAPFGNNPLKTATPKQLNDRRAKDRDTLELLTSSSPLSLPANINSRLLANTPILGSGLSRDSTVNLNLSYSKKLSDRAKENALKYVKRNGPLQKIDPHNLKGTEDGRKRALQKLSEIDESANKKQKIDEAIAPTKSDRFKKMLEATSAHADLVQDHEDSEKEKYFNKLERKEAMEEKMLSTYKVPCKAVRCLRCKYTSFSALDKCKEEQHPLRVFDTFKRFYKCLDCKNRTVSLELIPMHSCKNCKSSRWERTAMMREKNGVFAESLSIRGEEETFIGAVTKGNVNLLVPEE